MEDSSPFFGADWSLVLVESWLVTAVALVAVAVALRHTSRPFVAWPLWLAGVVAVGVSAFTAASSDCRRALAATASSSGFISTCAEESDLRRSVLLAGTVLLPCAVFLVVRVLTRTGTQLGWANVTVLAAAVAVGAGTLLLVDADQVDEGTRAVPVLL